MKAEDLDYSKSILFVVAENLYWPEMDQIRTKSFPNTFFKRVSFFFFFFFLGKLEDFAFDFVEELVKGRRNESKNKF